MSARMRIALVAGVAAAVAAASLAGVAALSGGASAQPVAAPTAFVNDRGGPIGLDYSGTQARTNLASLQLPAGDYALVAKAWFHDATDHATLVSCRLAGGDVTDTGVVALEPTVRDGATGTARLAALPFIDTAQLSAPGTVTLSCDQKSAGAAAVQGVGDQGVYAYGVRLLAVSVNGVQRQFAQ